MNHPQQVSPEQIELASISSVVSASDREIGDPHSGSAQGDALPRIDGGFAAWTYVAAATGLETLVWGLANSYGVFLNHYEKLFPSSRSTLPLVGTIANGEMYLLLPILTFYLSSRPHLRPWTMWLGLAIMTAGLVAGGCSDSVIGLIMTQGVLYGIGGTMLYCPTTAYLFEWWQAKRGLASGIIFSGTGLGGLIMPLISATLLQRYGHRTTLISIAIAYAILLGLLIPFIRPRLPLSHSVTTTRLDLSFARFAPFWVLWTGVLLQGLAAFMPATYLPAYATDLNLTATVGTLSIALMNLARVPGQILIGYASDKMGTRTLILAMAAASALSVLTGWGLAQDEGGVIGFAIAFGGFAGSYTALFPRFISTISKTDPNLAPILYALFSFARGLGSIASGPLSSALLASTSVRIGAAGWGGLILFTGMGMLGSGIGAGYKGLKVD